MSLQGSVIIQLLFGTLCLNRFAFVQADYARQPNIFGKDDGILWIESATDRNVTFRMSHNSALFVNEIDIMDKIRQLNTPPIPDMENEEELNSQQIQQSAQLLHEDLERWAYSLALAQNNTRNNIQRRTTRRLLSRLRLLNGRLQEIQRNLLKDECAEKDAVCENGGICYDGYKDFYCDCPEGWTGRTCKQDVDECYVLAGTELGCQNNGICINTPGSYRCSCAKGYSGTHCRLRNNTCLASTSAELCGFGTCLTANNNQGFVCVCDLGYTKDPGSETNSSAACNVDIDECHESRNPCHSECINLPGSFKCGPCPPGYTGNGFNCYDVNECAVDNGGCSLLPKVRCINTEGSYHCGNCPIGWTGDGRTCTAIPSNSCDSEKICHPQAKCEYISEIVTCTCPAGMFGHGFGPQGCHDTPINDPCKKHICQNNGTCLVTGRGSSCLCSDGYSGALCEIADGCHPSPCENNAACRPLSNQKYQCSCLRGTTGQRCEIIRSVCGNAIVREEGTLRYPMDDNVYENNERCAWIIRTTPHKILNITFTAFDLETTSDCDHDWLQIHDGHSLATQLIGRFCGKTLPMGGSFLSSQEQLFFWFRSDNATTSTGFNMIWKSQEQLCGDTNLSVGLNGAGIITSPGYPGKSAPNRRCEWHLKAPYGYRFVLRIYEINLGLLPNCTGDRFEIYDASIENGLLMEKFCKTTNPKPIRTSTNEVFIYFYTDKFELDSSFQLHYEVEAGVPHCGGIFTDSSGIIEAATDRILCQFLIQQPQGMQIKLNFLQYNPQDVSNCVLQMLQIYDGPTDEHPLLLRHCGKTVPEPITSTSNYMLIRFNNILHHSEQQPAFTAKYFRVCDLIYHGEHPRRITTSNYPQPYIDNVDCKFTIIGAPDTVVIANFTDFDISESVALLRSQNTTPSSLSDESLTYVDVYLSKTTKNRFYTGSALYHLMSEGNNMTIVFHATKNIRNARGFQIEYDFDHLRCGGVYTENQSNFEDTITKNKFFPEQLDEKGNFFINGSCKWIIEAPSGKYIRLSLKYNPFVLSKSNLLVFGGNNHAQKQQLLFNLVNAYTLNETFHYNGLTIFGPISDATNYYIEVNYTFLESIEKCGGNFTALWGIIKSPDAMGRDPLRDIECTWIIKAPIGHRIELKIQNFTLRDWGYDSLQIRNGFTDDSPLIGTYSGSLIPKRIISYTNSLFLRFKSWNYKDIYGFHITWQQSYTGCGGVLRSYKGSIHTPLSRGAAEEEEEHQEQCNWKIIVAQSSIIVLTLSSPNMDIQQLCNDPTLKIYDGPTTLSPLMTTNCTSLKPTDDSFKLYSSSEQVLVLFTTRQKQGSEVDREQPQFIIDYISNCNVIIGRVQGVIESPNFPDSYPRNIKCQWDVLGGLNNRIELDFSHLGLANANPSCNDDYVEVVDMQNEDILRKERFCSLPYKPFVTDGNRLMLTFFSDETDNRGNFRAEFARKSCGKHFYNDIGEINSPSAPFSVGMDCEWYIEGQPGTRILLNLHELHMESDSNDCLEDFLIIAETKDSSIPLLKECQTDKALFWSLNSPSHLMYIHYRSSAKRTRKYFKASYETQQLPCGGVYTSNAGYIFSPNYPNIYENQIKCVWLIAVPWSYGVELTFDEFSHRSESCNDTSLTLLLSTGDTKYEFCGNQKPAPQRIHQSSFELDYTISNTNGGGKFLLHYRKQCGGIINVSTIGSMIANANEECIWEVNIPEGNSFYINIHHMDCYCKRIQSNGLCENGLGIKENQFDNVDAANFTLYYCDQPQTNLIFKVIKLHIYARNIHFKATYSMNQEQCGGTVISLRGILTSPMYPSTYPSNVDCMWTIKATKGNTIQLQTEYMDIAASERCNQDFLEVRSSDNGPLLGIYCGKSMPEEAMESYEEMHIRFRSVVGSTGNGFKLSWTYGHSNEILQQASGVIEAPILPAARYEEQYFSWRIIVDRGYHIDLKHQQYTGGLNLYDGYDERAEHVHISSEPNWRFISSSNVLYLVTDNTNLEYFHLQWNATDGNRIFDGEEWYNKECLDEYVLSSFEIKNLSSPGYPHGYDSNLKCLWEIKPKLPTEHIILELYEINLEVYENCEADYLRVNVSTSVFGPWHEVLRICEGSKQNGKPSHIIHGTPYVRVELVTDGSVNGTGFTSKLHTMCGSNLTDTVGFIPAPTEWISMHHVCWWHIDVEKAQRINLELTFPSNASMYDEDCHMHALIYDGIDEHAALLGSGRICSNQKNTRLLLESSGRHVTIKYNLNRVRPEPLYLWNLTYRAFSECNGEVKLTNEVPEINITTPHYPNVPHTNTECRWIVIAPAGHTIRIKFVDRFSMNSRYCSEEFVEMFDGSTELSPSMGQYCKRPPDMHTSGNILLIHYSTTIAEPRTGFRASVSISLCGGNFIISKPGYITSLGYPATNAYPSHSQCDYYLSAPEHRFIGLEIKDLHIPFNPERSNASDYLVITSTGENSANPQSTVLFGNITDFSSIEIISSSVKISFNTFARVGDYRGFKIRYKSIGFMDKCHYYTNTPGIVHQINFLTHVPLRYCSWEITAGKTQRIRLEFLNMQDLKDFNLTSSPTFFVYDSHDSTSQIMRFDVNTYNASTIIRSTQNLMKFIVTIPKNLPSMPTLRFRYNFDELSPCPPDIALDNLSGEISLSDKHNEDFAKKFTCRLKFSLNINETLIFTIRKLSVIHKDDSKIFPGKDPLTIQDDEGYMRFKDNLTNVVVPMILFPKRSDFMIISSNDVYHISELNLKYQRYACGGLASIDSSFTVDYPQLPYMADKEVICVWTLKKYLSLWDITNDQFLITGNFSFSDNCEREYLEIYLGWLRTRQPTITLCRDNVGEFKAINLTNEYSRVVYKSLAYKPYASGFQLKVDRIISCDIKLEIDSFERELKINRDMYKNNQSCAWEMYANAGLYLKLKFIERFFIEDSPNCTNDYLEVRRLNDNIWWPEARFCGRQVQREYNTTTNHLQILFHTNEAITGDGFTIVLAADCVATFNVTNKVQIIQSPLASTSFRNSLIRCEYKFLADRKNVLFNVHVRINSELDYSKLSNITCRLGKFFVVKKDESGIEQPEKVHCLENFEVRAYRYVRIMLRAATAIPFTIEFSYETCGGNITQPHIIRSLRDDNTYNTYAHNMKCVWWVTAPEEHSILVRFRYFDMENRYDFVTIYNGHPTTYENEQSLAKLTGNLTTEPPTIVTDGNEATILAISDFSTAEVGFEAEIKFLLNCNERIALTTGNTPVTLMRDFKFNNTDEYLCHYRITAAQGYRIRINIKRLQLNSNDDRCNGLNCTAFCNYLEIFDSMLMNQASMGKLCATINGPLISSFEDVMIIFKASTIGQYSFEITLSMEKSLCSNLNEYELGEYEVHTLSFPPQGLEYYPANTHCKWRFKNKQPIKIHINYLKMQNISQVTGKCLDYLQFKSSLTSHIFCGYLSNYDLSLRLIPFEIIFHSDDAIEDKGFNLTITPQHLCDEEFTKLNDVLYFNRHLSNSSPKECNNIIKVPAEYRLNLYLQFAIFRNLNCLNSNFTILDYYTNETIWNSCKSVYDYRSFYTNTSAVRLLMKDLTLFQLSYVASERTLPPGCGGKLYSSKGIFKNPFYNDRNYSNCRWEIQVPPGNSITLTFTAFNMGTISNCQWDNVKIIQVMPDGMEKLMFTHCGEARPRDYNSDSNHLVVVASKSPNFDGTGWTISYAPTKSGGSTNY